MATFRVYFFTTKLNPETSAPYTVGLKKHLTADDIISAIEAIKTAPEYTQHGPVKVVQAAELKPLDARARW